MQVKNPQLLASVTSAPVSHRSALSTTVQPWRSVPLYWLEHCQPVDTQFVGFHLQFEAAIAIRPSNPRFQIADLPIALMPSGQGQHLKIHLVEPVKALEIWLVGSAAVTVSALDVVGHCLAMAQTQADLMTPDGTHLIAQKVVLETPSANAMHLFSKLPFMMTRVALKLA